MRPILMFVEHIHADPHFAAPLKDALGDRTFDAVVAAYGRLAEFAQVMDGRCGKLVVAGGMPVYRGCADPSATWPSGMKIGMRERDAITDEPNSPKLSPTTGWQSFRGAPR